MHLQQLKVAAYCRVSSRNAEQLNSLVNQADYYTDYIQKNPNWKLVGIFADQASGKTLHGREQFLKLLELCRNKQVDLVLTKSIKRFGRNTLDVISTCRELQTYGIDVYFELKHLWLSSPTSMLMISIFSALAQAELENISEYTKWGIRRSFEDEESPMLSRPCYGYYKTNEGQLIPHPDEANIVRQIFAWRLSGCLLREIAKLLAEQDVCAPYGGTRWGIETINKILHNEKYTGGVILQKSYVPNALDGKQKRNNGQLPKCYVENTHPAIISHADYERLNGKILPDPK